jgi:hypothetical protein
MSSLPSNSTSSAVKVNRSVWAASAWAFVFGAISIYWALGGRFGVGTLGNAFSDPAVVNDPLFIAFVWLTAILKLLLGLMTLALIQSWGNRIPLRLRLGAVWIAGLVLTLYGIALIVQHTLIVAGASAIPASIGTMDAVRWHLFLWDPFWLVGGVLFLSAASLVRSHQRRWANHMDNAA